MDSIECLRHDWISELNATKSSAKLKETPSLPSKVNFSNCNATPDTNVQPNGSDLVNGVTNGKAHAREDSDSKAIVQPDPTNKENVNLSRILVNRMRNSKGISLNSIDSNIATETKDNSDSAAESDAPPTKALTSASSALQYEQTVFPDAPTTPKVSRKSITDSAPPSCIALVKQFQMKYQKANAAGSDISIDGSAGAATKTSLGADRQDSLSTTSKINLLSLNIYHTVNGNTSRSQHYRSQIDNHANLQTDMHSFSSSSRNQLSSSSSISSCTCDKTGSSCCCSTTTLYRESTKTITPIENSLFV